MRRRSVTQRNLELMCKEPHETLTICRTNDSKYRISGTHNSSAQISYLEYSKMGLNRWGLIVHAPKGFDDMHGKFLRYEEDSLSSCGVTEQRYHKHPTWLSHVSSLSWSLDISWQPSLQVLANSV